MHKFHILCLLLFFPISGCFSSAAPIAKPRHVATLATPGSESHFDSANAGTIRGCVVWTGPAPKIPPFEAEYSPLIQPAWYVGEKQFPNPNSPLINASNNGLAEVVVSLCRVELDAARPWNHSPALAVINDPKLRIVEDGKSHRTGFVRKGSPLTVQSADKQFFIMRAGGAAFFSLTLPKPNKPRRRTLNKTGIVELTGGPGYFWHRAYVFVAEHPYFTRTGADGKFTIAEVPAGDYEIKAWMPNWHVASRDRDPEWRVVTRITFHEPAEKRQRVRVNAGSKSGVNFTFSADDFAADR